MILGNIFGISLPLHDPVLIFAIILLILLISPILLNRIKVPHLIGLIIAGIIVGPFGFNLLERDDSVILLGTVGLLYLMFIAGIEIDLADSKKNLFKSTIFGAYTFVIPMVLGTMSGIHLLGFSVNTSILMASMFASNTLITYPIASKLGITKNRAVNISVGGTILTTVLALLVLAVIVKISAGEASQGLWWKLGSSIVFCVAFILFVFPIIGRWFFKRVSDGIAQYVFILCMVFWGSYFAHVCGIEPIVGAFLSGLALNRLVPKISPLMNRIEFVGNALFIPFFLVGIGMLIDMRAFVTNLETVKVAIVMSVVATASKFIAAWLTQKTFRFTNDERRVIFGLSNAQAASTLAAVLVGYNIVLGNDAAGDPIRLLNESILNGTILMILVTCTIASFATQKGAQGIASTEHVPEKEQPKDVEERILIPIRNRATVNELVSLGTLIKSSNRKSKLVALNVITTGRMSDLEEQEANKVLESAMVAATATENKLEPVLRYDLNVVNGITNVINEYKITDLIIGLHDKKGITDSFFGFLTTGLLSNSNITTLIYKSTQPLTTIKRHLVIVPQQAERETGFFDWLAKLWNIGFSTGANVIFYAPKQTAVFINKLQKENPIKMEIRLQENMNLVDITPDLRRDDNLIFVMSRKTHASYRDYMSKMPNYLNKFVKGNSFILVYPVQIGVGGSFPSSVLNADFTEPMVQIYNSKN
jgi:Kef-type K+ transport system membrane component KefB